MNKVGFIDQRRLIAGGIPNWGGIPILGNPASRQLYGILEKFGMSYVLADAAEPSVPGWLCANTSAVLSMSDVLGGAVLMTTGGVDEDTGQMQLGDGAGGAFLPTADKDIWFEMRVRQTIGGTNTLNLAFGLQDPVGATEILQDAGAGAAANNRLMFVTLDTAAGNNAWSFEGDKAGVADTNALTTNLDSLTWHYYGFKVNGVTSVDVYYDRALVAAGAIATASIPVTALTPFVCIKTGAGQIETVEVDYCMCVQLI